jgi:hypothetical protein
VGSSFSTNGEKRNAYRISVWKLEVKRPLKLRRRWEDNIKITVTDTGRNVRNVTDWNVCVRIRTGGGGSC